MTLKFGPFKPVVSLLVIIWIIHFVNVITGGWLMPFGLEPRALRGLDGVMGAPFLHANLGHLLSNSAGLAVLGALICLQSGRAFWRVSAVVIIVGGMATWLLARTGLHVGASGLVFGYFGYLVMRGWVERTPMAVVVALLVAITYSGLLYGLLPGQRGISWEGHRYGFLAGMLAARWRVHHEPEATG